MLEMLETQLSASLLLLAMASELRLSAQVTSVTEGMKSTDRSMKTVKLTLVYGKINFNFFLFVTYLTASEFFLKLRCNTNLLL